MKSLRVTITGKTPLLMHAWHHLEADRSNKLQSPLEQAEAGTYRTAAGELCVPGYNLQRALIAGATFSKGKGKGTQKRNIAAGLFVRELEIGLGQKEFVVAMHRVVIAASGKGTAVTRYRARIDKWELVFTIDYDEVLLNKTIIEKVITDTGNLIGILDFRPEKLGPFGKFELTRITEAKAI
jgi:hypothetical protein